MAIETKKEKYVLSEKEKNERKAMAFLKGCVVGYYIMKGGKYSSTKEYGEEFAKGLKYVHPTEITSVGGYKYTRRTNANWITSCHIVHNKLRHNKPHTNDDDGFLSSHYEHEFKSVLESYNVDWVV